MIRALVIALLAARAVPARACPIELAGDPVATAAIGRELARFGGDAGPCLALVVQCRLADGALTLELRDELDGRATRTFESPAGAAAFLVSWSRRPLAATREHQVAPPPPSPSPPSLSAPAPHPGWRNEVALAGILAPTNYAGAVQVLRARTVAERQLGFGARALLAEQRDDVVDADGHEHTAGTTYVGLQVLALYGFDYAPVARGRLHGHVEAGASFVTHLEQSQVILAGLGPHAGVQLGAALQVSDALELELGIGVDLLLQRTLDLAENPFGPSNVYGFGHLHALLRWLP